MSRIILTVSSDLFDESSQEVSVRSNLAVSALIAEIKREFSLPDTTYAIYLKGNDRPLDPNQSLEQLGIRTGVELIFGREQRRLSQQMIIRGGNVFQAVSVPGKAFLREDTTGELFEIEWQPALIGRTDPNNPSSRDMITANLEQMAEGRSVSRRHARITELGGQYYLESLVDQNPTVLNGDQLLFGEKRGLKNGDKIRVGKIGLTFGVKSSGDTGSGNNP
jgi:hypothetical protein